MVTFISLFLGLIIGPHTIVLMVSEPVIRVEIVVDGSKVAEVAGEPWSLEFDFGNSLVPHDLVAVGFDAEDHEVSRVRQWLNLPRQPAETVISVEGDPEGEHRTARLTWESIAGKQPKNILVTFDQELLDVTDPGSISLPPHDPGQIHFLRAELEFEGDVTSNAEFVFGGDQLEEISSELTAVPLEPLKSRKIPPVEKVAGWFEVPTGPLEVIAWEKGAADIIIVPALGSLKDLHQIRNQEMSKPLPSAAWRRSILFGSQDWVLRLVWPISRVQAGIQTPFELFAHSAPPASESGNLLRWLTEIEPPPELKGSQRLSDAVAVAGVTVAGKRGRRGIVLLLGDEEADTSRLSPSQVQKYLRALHVPLQVWSTRPQGSATGSWGPSVDISSPGKLQKAMNQLFESLDGQQVVWLAGYHLPQDIELTPSAKDIRLVQ